MRAEIKNLYDDIVTALNVLKSRLLKDNAFDKFDAYFQKFEDRAKEHEEKYGKGTADWSHRQYQKYRTGEGGNQSQDNYQNFAQNKTASAEEKKHLETLESKEGATFDEIKANYNTLMKKYHPDKFQDEEKKKQKSEGDEKVENLSYYPSCWLSIGMILSESVQRVKNMCPAEKFTTAFMLLWSTKV